jgi:hypothetical protein
MLGFRHELIDSEMQGKREMFTEFYLEDAILAHLDMNDSKQYAGFMRNAFYK